MARLTNKQLEIVVDEIYKEVSLPIIESNKKALDAIEIKDDEYLLDCKKYKLIQEKIETLDEEKAIIRRKYRSETVKGFKFTSWNDVMNYVEEYTKHLKTQQSKPKEYPSKDDIEREIILTGNADIPELIENIVNKLK